MDASDEKSDDGVGRSSSVESPPRSARAGDNANVSASGGRTRSTRRKYVAESETLTSIASDAEERLAAKRKDRVLRRELR